MLSDRALFEAEDLIAMALRHLNETPSELHLGNRYSGLARITRQCLANEPADRPPSLLALREALGRTDMADSRLQICTLVSCVTGQRINLDALGSVVAN